VLLALGPDRWWATAIRLLAERFPAIRLDLDRAVSTAATSRSSPESVRVLV
jgi:hypothetical protein